MLASDLIRAVVALAFIATVRHPSAWLLYTLSALLMFASPFFTSGRASILPVIASPAELHTANSLTQTTQWATLTAGTMLAGYAVARFGFVWAFTLNSLSFVFSAYAVWQLRAPGGFTAARGRTRAPEMVRPWHAYVAGLDYIRATPLVFWIGMVSVGWATGGGAAQILFTLFGEQVFGRGAAGIGTIWGFAGLGLLIGGGLGHLVGRRAGFAGYKRAISISYIAHGAAYVAFSQMRNYGLALGCICLSRVGMAVSSVLNYSQLLRHTPDRFRGRVFSTMESLRWAVMIISMAAAGICSQYFSPRAIGATAGILSSLTAVAWAWADGSGRIPEPAEQAAGEEAEVTAEPGV